MPRSSMHFPEKIHTLPVVQPLQFNTESAALHHHHPLSVWHQFWKHSPLPHKIISILQFIFPTIKQIFFQIFNRHIISYFQFTMFNSIVSSALLTIYCVISYKKIFACLCLYSSHNFDRRGREAFHLLLGFCLRN